MPAHERYNLASQIKSAATSLTSNIAEGFGRYHYKENVQFCRIARGSACELIDHLTTCLDEGYLQTTDFEELNEDLETFQRLLNGYIKMIGRPATYFITSSFSLFQQLEYCD